MKVPRRVDGSVYSAVLLKKRPSVALARGFCSSRDKSKEIANSRLGNDYFCARSSQWLHSTFAPPADSRRPLRIPRSREASHTYSTAAAATEPGRLANQTPRRPVIQDKDELMSFLDYEGIENVEEHLNYYRDPLRSGYAHSDGPTVRVSERRRDVEFPSREETVKVNDETRHLIIKLCSAIGYKLRHPQRTSLDSIYKLYLKLPEPRMLYLTWQWKDRLLKVMGTPAKHDTESMLRYFALIADIKNVGLTLRRSHWNFALSYATKYAARITATEMESGLRLWREMEHDARIRGNEVTFNILFDVATKAGNFTLADMIYKEMENRGLSFNRYHHVSLIHYFGLKLDSEGIRAAYKDMVQSGEMIDTLVLNCVIAGLLRCGEEPAAEKTYERMKNGYTTALEMPERNYLMNRVITKVLMMFTRVGKRHPGLRKTLQTNIQLAPNLHTYKLLVEHYAVRVGDLTKVAQYLDEMKYLKITIDPTIFLALFKGFYIFGGYPRSDWSEQRLEGVLMALFQARDENVKGFRIDRWLAIWALRAVNKCSTPDAVSQTFDSIAERWDIPPSRQSFMYSLLGNIMSGSDMKSSMGNFEGPSHQRVRKDGHRL